jgi:hypothetical protein
MRTIKQIYLLAATVLLLGSCIDRFYLSDLTGNSSKLVVEGTILDNCETQQIRVSYSTTDEYLSFDGVKGCKVQVTDTSGKTFEFTEEATVKGYYDGTIPDENLTIGNKFRVEVTTPEGKTYRSNFEEMLPTPPIDSIYYSIKQQESTGGTRNGIQYYIDFSGSSYYGNYYRWVIDETYEYHSTWPKQNYIDESDNIYYGPIDYSTYTCYKTETIDNIFLLSTEKLTSNQYKKTELNFVDDNSQRLLYNYSILVKQRSLSKNAYLYWESMKANQDASGLYPKQPTQPQGNIYNIADSSEVVLGYFSASSETTKRNVIKGGVKGLPFDDVGLCEAISLEDRDTPVTPRPLYLITVKYTNGTSGIAYANTECFDCTLLGGTLTKPSFFK